MYEIRLSEINFIRYILKSIFNGRNNLAASVILCLSKHLLNINSFILGNLSHISSTLVSINKSMHTCSINKSMTSWLQKHYVPDHRTNIFPQSYVHPLLQFGNENRCFLQFFVAVSNLNGFKPCHPWLQSLYKVGLKTPRSLTHGIQERNITLHWSDEALEHCYFSSMNNQW